MVDSVNLGLRRRVLKGRKENEGVFNHLGLRRGGVNQEGADRLSDFNVVRLLKACANEKDILNGSQLHAYIQEHKFLGKDPFVVSSLVSMYARCGELAKAQLLLEELPVHNIVTWNALITEYVQQGQAEEALKCFDQMQRDGHSPNATTFICALKACGRIGAVAHGERIHDKIVSLGLLEKNIMLGSTLVDMYARCGALLKARQVLEELPVRNVVTWTALIAGYTQQGQGEEALKCLDSMQRDGHAPNAVTFICALKACGSVGAVDIGEQIHNKLVSLGLLEKNVVLGSTLVNMYAKCGVLVQARQVLAELPARDVVSWTALIAGYAQQGQGEEALRCFDSMQRDGHSPDAFTFTCALKACGSIRAVTRGQQIHGNIVSLGMLEKNMVLGNTLVDMYARCGALAEAQQVLTEIPVRSVITWNVLIAGYAQQGQGEEALKCLDSMLYDGHSPDALTFMCALKACGFIGAIAKGEQIHDMIVNLRMVEKNVGLGNALVDMYARCGALAKAHGVFAQLPVQDVVAWTAFIAGYAMQGKSMEAISCFERMQSSGVMPDSTALISVLNACSQSGLLNRAEVFLSATSSNYGITPDLEHFCCLVDLFGRAGKLKKALDVIGQMPTAEYFPVWAALLGACRSWGEVTIGRLAFECGLRLDKSNAAIYICMDCIYRRAGMREDADKIELMRVANRAWKMTSWL